MGRSCERITLHHPLDGIFGNPFWLTRDGRVVSAHAEGDPDRPLVFSPHVSRFVLKWGLLDQLHAEYGQGDSGRRVLDWLTRHAAFTISPDPEIELAAFAAMHADSPIEVSDDDLREIRDRFDLLSDRRAPELGHRVGGAILVESFSRADGGPARQRNPRGENMRDFVKDDVIKALGACLASLRLSLMLRFGGLLLPHFFHALDKDALYGGF